MTATKTAEMKITIKDNEITYSAEITGVWSRSQIIDAFAHRYDTGDLPEHAEVDCEVIEGAPEHLGPFILFANGDGGTDCKKVFPHAVTWKAA